MSLPTAIIGVELNPNLTRDELLNIVAQNWITINNLILANQSLREEKAKLESDNRALDAKVKSNEETIKALIARNNYLESRIQTVESEIRELRTDKQKLEALVYLDGCGGLINRMFKTEYKKAFKKRRQYVPNIGDYIEDPPADTDDDYKFWEEFKAKHPKCVDSRLRSVRNQISENRGKRVHFRGSKTVTKEKFDEALAIANLTEYENNKELYHEYRDWLIELSKL